MTMPRLSHVETHLWDKDGPFIVFVKANDPRICGSREWFVEQRAFGLLAVVEGADGDALAGFLAAADNRLQLHAEGKPTLGVALDPRCWWQKNDRTFVAVPFGDADRRDLAEKVEYRVAASNASAAAQWQLAAAAERVRRE